ncbi:MAG: TrkA family potassium uptake protein [Limnochordaceae bacterium]|nr:TrkA family potassium uptake protein [Limnochordaceae bacterium]
MAVRRRSRGDRQFVVLGLGRFGTSVARTLYQLGFDVLGIDMDEQKVQEVSDQITHAVQADCTDEEALSALGVRNFDVGVVAIGDLEASVLAVVILQELGVRTVIAKAVSELHGRVLEKVGANHVVYPERDMGVRVAHYLVPGNVLDYFPLAPGYSLLEIKSPDRFAGHSLRELDLRGRYGAIIVAVRRGEVINPAPGPEFQLEAADVLVALGRDEDLERLEQAGAENA